MLQVSVRENRLTVQTSQFHHNNMSEFSKQHFSLSQKEKKTAISGIIVVIWVIITKTTMSAHFWRDLCSRGQLDAVVSMPEAKLRMVKLILPTENLTPSVQHINI